MTNLLNPIDVEAYEPLLNNGDRDHIYQNENIVRLVQ